MHDSIPNEHSIQLEPEKPHRHQGRWSLLLFLTALIWGAAFFMVKEVVDEFSPSTLVGWRFLIAALLVLLFFFKRIRKNLNLDLLKSGAILGLLYYLGFWVQTIGITDTSPGKNAFLTALYCVMVPFLYWLIFKQRPRWFNLLAAAVGISGIAFVSLQDGSFNLRFGDWMTLLSALFFALHIVFLSKYAEGKEIMSLTFVQFGCTGILGLVVGAFESGGNILPHVQGISSYLQLFYLIVFSSFLACVFQNVGQVHVSASQSALILALESVFGVLFSILFYGEALSFSIVIGFVLIFISVVISETFS